MTYQSIRNRIASVAPSLSESQLDWAAPLAVGAATGLGASAFNVVSPWDIDPVAASLASGSATYLMGRGRTASPVVENLAESVVAAPPRKPPTNPPSPTPSPRVATEADVAPSGLVVPTPTIDDYIAKSPLLIKDRARQYADPSSGDYQPDFVKMISQDLSDEFRSELAFPEDVLTNQFRGSGVPAPVASGATYLPILSGSFNYPSQRAKLNSDVIVFRGSNLVGGEGKSNLVNQGVVPEGTYYPNAVTSNPQSLGRIAAGKDPDLIDPGYFIKDPSNGIFKSVIDPNPAQAKEAYTQLTNSGRMATPMGYKNLTEPMLYVDELGGGSSPYNINDFYGLRSAKKRTTDKTTGQKYYRGVID